MRSSALAGFLASAVLVSGSAGFASTFLVGPYLGDQVRHQGQRAGLMSSAAPVDPLAVLQIPSASAATASLDGEAPASQTAHRLRKVENAPTAQTTTVSTPAPAPATTPAVASTDMPGPITEEAFAPTAPNTFPVSSGGPLIASETSSAMIASKLENGEPVLTLRIAPVVAATAPTVDSTDPEDAVEPTVMSAPPSEQALVTPIATAPEPVAQPVAPPPAPEPATRPRTKPAAALQPAAPEPAEPTRRATTKPKPAAPTPARVTATAAPAPAIHHVEEPVAPPPAPDPLNAPYMPSTSPTLGTEEPSTAPASGAPASMTPQPESTSGPTPLTMPQ